MNKIEKALEELVEMDRLSAAHTDDERPLTVFDSISDFASRSLESGEIKDDVYLVLIGMLFVLKSAMHRINELERKIKNMEH